MRATPIAVAVIAVLTLSTAAAGAALQAPGPLRLPPAAVAREQAFRPHVGPHARGWINAEAQRVAANPSLDVKADLAYANLGNLSAADVEAIVFLVMMEAAKDADQDLQAIMAEAKAQAAARQSQRSGQQAMRTEKADLTNAMQSEFSDTQSQRLQMAMDRRSKLMETLSNLLKKMSDTDAGIVQNIK